MAASSSEPPLIGTYLRQADRKGRVAWPMALNLQATFVLTSMPERSLVAMTVERWQRLTKAMAEGTEWSAWIGGSFPVTLKRNRGCTNYKVQIPQLLRDHAGLEPGCEVLLIGQDDFVLLCRPDWWAKRTLGAIAALTNGR